MKKLKDLAILSAGALLTVSLAACGNTNHSDDKNSSKVSTSKVAKSSSKKISSSSSSISSSSSSIISSSINIASSSVAPVTSSASITTNTQTQQTSTQNNNNQNNNAQPTTLTGFVAKYGTSPAAYKMQYEGMTERQVLASTSDNMKTSGEIQLSYQLGIE